MGRKLCRCTAQYSTCDGPHAIRYLVNGFKVKVQLDASAIAQAKLLVLHNTSFQLNRQVLVQRVFRAQLGQFNLCAGAADKVCACQHRSGLQLLSLHYSAVRLYRIRRCSATRDTGSRCTALLTIHSAFGSYLGLPATTKAPLARVPLLAVARVTVDPASGSKHHAQMTLEACTRYVYGDSLPL